MAGGFFLRVVVANGAALLHRALDFDDTRLEQQGFGQGSLAGTAVTHQRNATNGFRRVARHKAHS